MSEQQTETLASHLERWWEGYASCGAQRGEPSYAVFNGSRFSYDGNITDLVRQAVERGAIAGDILLVMLDAPPETFRPYVLVDAPFAERHGGLCLKRVFIDW